MKNRCEIHSGVPREYKNTPRIRPHASVRMCFRTDTGSVPTRRPVVRLSLWFNCQCRGGARFTRASRPHVGTDPVSVRIVWMAMSVCMYLSECMDGPPVFVRTYPPACVFGQTRGLSLQGVLSSAPHYGLTVNAVGGARAAKAGA